VPAGQAPKGWKDINNPAFKDGISAKLATSGMQHAQWYTLRKLYGNEFWQEFAKQRPKGFDARAQLFDRLSKGEDRMCVLAEYAGYTLFQEKGADIEFVAPADGLPATSFFIGVVNRAPHPEAARLFVDWAFQARPDGVPEPEDPALRVARERHGADAHWQAAVGLQAPVPSDWADFAVSHASVREGVELDHGEYNGSAPSAPHRSARPGTWPSITAIGARLRARP
jgi:hypothetical protein